MSARNPDLDRPLSEVCRDVYAEMRRSTGRPTGRRIADVFSEADKSAQFREEVRERPPAEKAAKAAPVLTSVDSDPYAQIRVQEGSGAAEAQTHTRDHAHAQGEPPKLKSRPKRVAVLARRDGW